ncbi:MAG: efflux RND transporter periplasmic adaptor subunit [Rubripirellula sp.]
MPNHPVSSLGVSLLLISCAAIIGCDKSALEDTATGPVTVTVSTPVSREVTDFAQYVGRTEAVNSVDIKARVTGYLQETPFKEGADVNKGDELFLIDPRPYQAQLDAAAGELQANEAKHKLAQTENERAKALYKENPKAISLKSLDQHQAEEDAAAAAVVASRSSMEVYQLNLDFTKIVSPIAGRVGRYQVTIGNLVTENTTTLTSVVSQDPMYVYFNVDEPTIRDALRKLMAGQLPTPASGNVQVGMEMPDETSFPRTGVINFADNTIDPLTGTITLRASFANPASKEGVRMMLPGMFVRIRLPLGRPRASLLIAEQAIGTDQGQKYVYVVDDKNTVQYRSVVLGQLQDDGLRVVTEGLQADERVILQGLQLVRPNDTVKPEVAAMPTNKTTDPGTTTATNRGATTNSNPASNRRLPQAQAAATQAPDSVSATTASTETNRSQNLNSESESSNASVGN